jgi:GNAT superfamily N-acetyltransferase
VNELERVEAAAYRSAAEAAADGLAHEVRGGTCLAVKSFPTSALNRVVGVTRDLDVDAALAFYAEAGLACVVSVPPGLDDLERDLGERGFTRDAGWMKFERGAEPPPEVATALHVEETSESEIFARIAAEGFGAGSSAAASAVRIVGRPGWHCFLARSAGDPAAVGALFADGETGWLGVAATRPEFRGRGGQNAIMRARIVKAIELGLRRLTVETGARVGDRPAGSYRNILRAGFRDAYVRPNWTAPR